MTLLTRNKIQQLLSGEWEEPLPYFDKSATQLWDEEYEDYVSEGGNYVTEEEGEEARYDPEAFAEKRGMLTFTAFLLLQHAANEMKFTDEERQKLQQAVRETENSMEGLKSERIESLLIDWRHERTVMEDELIRLIEFMALNGTEHDDWPNTIKAMFTDYIYTCRMCYKAARMLSYVDSPGEVCVPLRPPVQGKDESKEDYKKRLIEYASAL